MTSTIEQVKDMRGILVKLGLGQPSARGFCSFAVVAGIAYLASYPKGAFDDEGGMRPWKPLSPSPTATNAHFLTLPLAVGVACYLFT